MSPTTIFISTLLRLKVLQTLDVFEPSKAYKMQVIFVLIYLLGTCKFETKIHQIVLFF